MRRPVARAELPFFAGLAVAAPLSIGAWIALGWLIRFLAASVP